MEALAIISLVGNIIQFVNFGSKLISKSTELYRSSEGALGEYIDTETTTNHLVLLNSKLKDGATTTSDGALESLCKLCSTAADDLLAALDKIKVKGKRHKWKSIRKALRSVWSKEEISEMELRLARFREELNFHIIVDLREQVSQFKLEQSDRLEDLDLITKKILNAIIKQEDVFLAAHDSQLSLMRTLHNDTVTKIDDQHEITRHEIREQRDIDDQKRNLAELPIAVQAAFNSYDKQHDPLCLADTRVDILNDIRTWADSRDERCIFWLSGLAGTGKSTIARTIAREYHEQKRLGASFFFSRGGGDTSHAGKFFTSIAVHLASKSPSLRHYICEAIAEHSDIATKSLRDQWHQLVLGPLSKLNGSSSQCSLVLVVDALDECEGENDVRVIVQLLAEVRSLKYIGLRVFMTSRPEIPIRHGFYQIPEAEHQDFVLHNISTTIIDHDISIFLEHNLRIIGQERALAAGWPGEQAIRCLVQSASGLFIWAATACRFIREGKKFAAKRLSVILQGDSSTTAPEKQLNEIYVTVLKNCVCPEYDEQETEDLYNMLRGILGSIVVLFSPLSAHALRDLLHLPKVDVDQTLEDLHSILDVPDDQASPIRLHHPSFRDFLLDKDRCSDRHFCVDEKQAHGTLVGVCMRLMSTTLKRDICGLRHPGALADDVESSRVEQCIPPAVQYACIYWVEHLQRSGAQLYDQVYQFLREHLLHWLEALSYMEKTSDGILAIISLESIVPADKSSGLYAFIHDAKRFALYNRSIMEEAPLQIYCSSLIFAPEKSLVRQQFEQMPRWIQMLPQVQKDWSPLLQTIEGHSDIIYDITFSPNGKLLASASEDTTVRLWNAATGTALQTLEGHSKGVVAVVFSPDGKLVASASWDKTVMLWDAAAGAALQTLEGHSNIVRAIVISRDGKLVASASEDTTVRLWDAATGAVLQTLAGHSREVRAVTFSPDDKLLASASEDTTVRLWDVATGAALQTFEGHSDIVRAFAFSPDGKLLVSTSQGKTVSVWDAAAGAALQTFVGHSRLVKAVVFSPDGKLLASASEDTTVRLWDAATGAALQTLKGHSDIARAIIFSPDSKLLASTSVDNTVRLWDAATGAALQTLEGHSDLVGAIVFSPDGKLLASAPWDKTVRLWEAATRTSLQTSARHSEEVTVVLFSPECKLVASASWDGTVKLWDAATGTALQTLEGHLKGVVAVVFSPDGKLVASASWDGTVKLWDAATGTALQTLEGHSKRVVAIVFSPDGKLVASASYDNTVRLWDAATGWALQTLEGHSKGVVAVVFSPDGKLVASASWDKTVRLWDLAIGAALQTLEGHSKGVVAVVFSPDGKLLASASEDATVRLWNAAMGTALQTLEGHSTRVRAVVFSPDGKLVASASWDKTVMLWDAATGAPLQRLKTDTAIKTLSFSNDGSYLRTDRGLIDTVYLSPSAVLPQSNPAHSIFVKERWIAQGMENFLWLPSDYRATCAAASGNILVLGHPCGRVTIFEFNFAYTSW